MELRFELPEIRDAEDLFGEFQDKVVDPFNRAFARFQTRQGYPCFQIQGDLYEYDFPKYPRLLAPGRLFEIKTDHDDPKYVFCFHYDGTGWFGSNRFGMEHVYCEGSHAEIFERVFQFIKAELEPVVGEQGEFADQLEKVEAAIALLAKE